MFQKPSKYLMSEEGGTPASAAAAAPTPSAEPTAASTTAPALDVDTLITRLTGVIDEKITASQNATHAALRKAGVFEKVKPTEATPTAPTTSAPAVAQAGVSMADLDARLELERVVASREAKHSLSEAQVKRLRGTLNGVARDSLAAEADSYLNDMGLVKAAPTQTATATQAQTTTAAATVPALKPNISDRGTASPSDLRDFEGVLNSRPLEMNGHDVESLLLKHGEHKGYQMFQEHVLRALGKVKIKPPRG